jgi:hypothetical protein
VIDLPFALADGAHVDVDFVEVEEAGFSSRGCATLIAKALDNKA